MKKLYTFLVVVFIGFVGKAQIVNIPDANFKAWLLQASSSNDRASSQTPVYDSTLNIWQVETYNTVDTNADGEIQITEALAIKHLEIYGTNISNLSGIEAFVNLQALYCNNLPLTSLNLSSLQNLKFLNCRLNQLTSLNVSGNANLEVLKCGDNQLTTLTVSGLANLRNIDCDDNQILNLDLSGVSNLRSLICNNNQLGSLDFSVNTNLEALYCYSNQLTSLNVVGLTSLRILSCGTNQLTSLNASDLISLQTLGCQNNQLTSIDISSSRLLNQLYCSNNQLNSLFIKNNYIYNWAILDFQNNPSLSYICADEADFTYVQNKINSAGYASTCHVNSYCSFTPGGIFYTFQGNTSFDSGSNGCNVSDINIPNQRFTVANGPLSGSFISNTSGSYFFPVAAGSHTITPTFEDPSYFTSSPGSA